MPQCLWREGRAKVYSYYSTIVVLYRGGRESEEGSIFRC